MLHWIFDVVVLGGGFYLGMRYGKYPQAAGVWLKSQIRRGKAAL